MSSIKNNSLLNFQKRTFTPS